jgi:hypothetical protein
MMDMFSESTIRGRARRLGYVVKKSRRRKYTNWDRGGYTLIYGATWTIVVGPNFDADLEDVAAFLAKREAA